MLNPGASQVFEAHGFSASPQRITERMVCSSMVDKISSVIFESDATCKFDNPLLKFENPLVFTWNYSPGTVPGKQVS